ncbi:HPr kinase/phosphorylase [Sandaracinobacteroides hominis]|uniref:HPr kinase/phosphorylase n=1 Tax=Sandaracinobacteroides hominis TaxID=2780086 RepID=UPI0018F581E8|nr:HPr kinase/phosphatase C-terminal domain-containing protein [Sandaracinobacteroides hominis]
MNRTIHATAVSIGGAGVLLLGEPGCGKSDLALRLIDRGARLVADDRVIALAEDGELRLSAPETLKGLIEVRGVGILAMPFETGVRACLAVRFSERPERLPERELLLVEGVSLPALWLAPFEASTPIKVELAVAQVAARG